ncbi:MAG: hypothetical protein ACLFSE_07950 [Spirochaetia bacterium]
MISRTQSPSSGIDSLPFLYYSNPMNIPMYRCVILLPLMLLAVLPVTGLNNLDIITKDSSEFVLLQDLALQAGAAPISGSGPYCREEVLDFLDNIPAEALDSRGRILRARLRDQLAPDPFFSFPGGLNIDIAPSLTLEANLRTGSTFGGWVVSPGERTPAAELPLSLWLGPWFYAEMEASLREDPFAGARESWGALNIPTNFSAVDNHYPYRAFLNAGGSHWLFRFGRDQLSWGNGRTGNMILSDTAPYHDFAELTFFWDVFQFTTAALSLESWNDDGTAADEYRMFFSHRFEVRLWDRLNLAVTEGISIRGEYFEFRYLNPLMVYHNWFLNDRDGNIIFSLEAEYTPWKYFSVYGQLCADTITSRYEKERYGAGAVPDAFGYIAGIRSSVPLGKGSLRSGFEWAYTDPWMYIAEGQPDFTLTRRFISNYLGRKMLIHLPLGYSLGPDGAVYDLFIQYASGFTWQITAALRIQRKGEIDLYTPLETGEEAVAMTSPTGIPETETVVSLSGEYRFPLGITAGGGIFLQGIKNPGHEAGAYLLDLQFLLRIKYSLK